MCALLLLLALSTGGGRAETPAVEAPELITSIQQFRDLSLEQKSRPHDIQLECTVTFFDPIWRLMFIQDEFGRAAYVPLGDNPYPFKTGERLLAQGRLLPPNAELSFEHVRITRIGLGLPTPVPATDAFGQRERFRGHYVSLVGFVDRERRADEHHLQLLVSVNGYTATVWVVMDPQTPSPGLDDRKVRIEGVYNDKGGPVRSAEASEIMVSSLAKVTPLGRLDDEPGFSLPITPISEVAQRSPTELVRVVGSVMARETGPTLRIRDNTGQVDLVTGQQRPISIDETIEAIGFPSVEGATVRLKNALFRKYARNAAGAGSGAGATTIGLAADVLALSPEEAAQGRPVVLTGVVIWSNPKSPFFFINDSSGGICVMRGASTSTLRSLGRNLEVRGVTGMGPFAPVVIASTFDRVGDSPLPMARQISVEHALTGVEEAQWVEMRGYLRRINREGDWAHLELATATSDFTAVLPATEDVSHMIGSVVRIHGVCTAVADSQRKLTGVKLYVPGLSYVQIDEAAPPDPFLVPARSLASLGQFETVQAFNRRVRVAGTVLQHVPGHSIRLAEADHSLLVLSRSTEPLQPGDRVEAVGFLGRQGGRVTLREAVYRLVGSAPQPEPRAFEPHGAPVTALDGLVVRIEGTLLSAALIGRNAKLTIQAPQRIFEASLRLGEQSWDPPELDSRVAVTGVYEIVYDEHGRAGSFELGMRSPADLAVLESPSWWTRGRILAITGLIALVTLLVLGWVTVLRRQVQYQTGQIREQMEREGRLQVELARAGKLESLGLLAGGIAHDFNNLLTVLMGNISLVRLDPVLGRDSAESLAQAEKAAGRARDLTQQLLTFAKGGAPLRTAVSLPEVVREVSEFALHGSQVRCCFDLADDLWTADVDKGQIGQVVQNIVINALQAMPDGGVLDVAMSNQDVGADLAGVLAPGRYVRLDFTDHGPGISQADLSRIFDPYFTTKRQGSGLGLATVHSIVKKHAGFITAESEIGRGTTFRIWLPAAAAGVVPAAPLVAPPVSVVNGHAGARVLLMDDEEFIRNLGTSILKRYGYRPTAVGDGQAALTEYRQARETGEPYQLVILDLTIPGGMGGRQTIEELLKLDPGVRAIVSSGYSNDLVLANYQAHGFRGMISKPYDVADFAHAVERVLKGERA